MRRRPDSTRPLMYPEAVRLRHDMILLLWHEPVLGLCLQCGGPAKRQRTRKEIAQLVGLRDGGTVGRHVDHLCRCEA